MDLLYRDLRLVDRVLEECAQGVTTCHYQPGHPHGFHTHIYAGEVHHNVALYDPNGSFAARQAQTWPYPANLKNTIVRRYPWEAEFATVTAAGAAREADRFAASPRGFATEVAAILRGLHPEPARLRTALEHIAALTAAVCGRCGDVLGDRDG